MNRQINIEEIWGKIDSTMKASLSAERYEKITKMFEEIGERFLTAPSSIKVEYGNCFPGGLADHTLRAIKYILKLSSIFEGNKYTPETLVTVALLHDLGKIGNETSDFFIQNDSDWHQKRGILYSYNEDILFAHSALRSLYLIHKFGIVLTEDEWVAIYLNRGAEDEHNKPYANRFSPLASLLHMADQMAMAEEKKRT